MKISLKKREKISEQILTVLFSASPQFLFTSEIAREIARDEEFVKTILLELKKKRLVVEIRKNPKGNNYLRRVRWGLSDGAYKAYNDYQFNPKDNYY